MPHSAIWESTLNGKSRNVSIGDIHLVNALDNLKLKTIPSRNGEEKHSFYFKEKLLSDFQ